MNPCSQPKSWEMQPDAVVKSLVEPRVCQRLLESLEETHARSYQRQPKQMVSGAPPLHEPLEI